MKLGRRVEAVHRHMDVREEAQANLQARTACTHSEHSQSGLRINALADLGSTGLAHAAARKRVQAWTADGAACAGEARPLAAPSMPQAHSPGRTDELSDDDLPLEGPKHNEAKSHAEVHRAVAGIYVAALDALDVVDRNDQPHVRHHFVCAVEEPVCIGAARSPPACTAQAAACSPGKKQM